LVLISSDYYFVLDFVTFFLFLNHDACMHNDVAILIVLPGWLGGRSQHLLLVQLSASQLQQQSAGRQAGQAGDHCSQEPALASSTGS